MTISIPWLALLPYLRPLPRACCFRFGVGFWFWSSFTNYPEACACNQRVQSDMEPADAGGEQRAEAAAFALEALEAQRGEEEGEGEEKRAGHERRWARGEAADEQCAKAQFNPWEGFSELDKQGRVGGQHGQLHGVEGIDEVVEVAEF